MIVFNRKAFAQLTMTAAMTLAVLSPACTDAAQADSTEVLQVWPGASPGTENKTMVETEAERDLPGVGKVRVKTGVNVPTISVFRPAAGKANGAAVVVLPGGGFGGLAWDMEGTEPARWLAERGITAFVLKYRVGHIDYTPGQPLPTDFEGMLRLMEPGRRLALADATQALKLIREQAGKFGIDPERVGMMGFSAGAITTMGVVLQADASMRPNFAAPVYGVQSVEASPAADAPALFIVHAQDDGTVPADSSTRIFDLWQKAKRPAELHIYAQGGHGFGMRARGLPVDHWPAAFEIWMKSLGVLDAARTEPKQ